MATEGKVPLLGFKAAAAKFLVLFGFSPNDSVATPTPAPIPMTGSYSPSIAMAGSLLAQMTGSYSPGIAMTGSVSDG
jgi:hypothetical protein